MPRANRSRLFGTMTALAIGVALPVGCGGSSGSDLNATCSGDCACSGSTCTCKSGGNCSFGGAAAAGTDGGTSATAPPNNVVDNCQSKNTCNSTCGTGCTTTCDALWMGVPVVALNGPTMASRAGATLLSCTELSDLVAAGAVEYRHIAISLAGNVNRLQGWRQLLRPAMMRGAANGRRFCRELGNALKSCSVRTELEN